MRETSALMHGGIKARESMDAWGTRQLSVYPRIGEEF